MKSYLLRLRPPRCLRRRWPPPRRARCRRADLQAPGRPQRHRLHLREVRLRLQAALGDRAELYRGDQGPRPRPVGNQGHDAGLGRVRADRRRRLAGSAQGALPRRFGGVAVAPAPARTCWSAAGTSRSRCNRSAPRGSSGPGPPPTSRSSSSANRSAGAPRGAPAWRRGWRRSKACGFSPAVRSTGASSTSGSGSSPFPSAWGW